jgi:hypothetical protein
MRRLIPARGDVTRGREPAAKSQAHQPARPVVLAGWGEQGESGGVEVAKRWRSVGTRAPMDEDHRGRGGGVLRSVCRRLKSTARC